MRSGWSRLARPGLLPLALSALALQSFYFHVVAGATTPRPWHLVLALPAVALLALLLRPVLRWLRGRLADRSRRGLAALAFGFAVAGWLLTWAIPVPPAPVAPVDLEVEATGGKSPAAVSSEVWVRLQRDGVSIPPGEISHDGKWQTNGEFLVSVPGKQPAVLHWSGEAAGQVRLIMVSHPWSGKARVRIGGRTRELDLYSAGSDAVIIPLAGGEATDDRLVYPDRSALQSWVQCVDGLLIGASLLAIFLALGTRPLPALRTDGPAWPMRRELLLHAMPTLLVGGVLLALFFPGLMTSDSLDQWRQAGAGEYNDAHPLLYALTIRALRQAWDSPAIVAAAQCAAMAFAAAWLIALVRRALGAGIGVAHAGAWLVALHPMVALTNITLWKDVFYTVAVVVLTGYLVAVVFLDRTRLSRPLPLAGLVLAAIACMSLRHNGPPVAVATFVIIFLLAKDSRRYVLLAAVASISGFLLLKGPVARWLDVHRTDLSYVIFVHHIGAHVAQGHLPHSDADRKFLRSLDRNDPSFRYNCATVNPSIFDNAFEAARASENVGRLRAIWLELASERPDIEVGHSICKSAVVWRMVETPPLYLSGIALWAPQKEVRWIMSSRGDPVEHSIERPLANAIGKALLGLDLDVFWRPAAYLYLLCLGVGVAAFRYRSKRWLLIAATCVVHSLVLAAASVAQDARYQLPVYVVALAVAPLLLIGRRASTREESRHDEDAPGLERLTDTPPDAEPLASAAVTVVIPCYRVVAHIAGVIDAIGPEVARIYCVDDACPDGSGRFIAETVADPRVRVVRHARNQGVGGAVMTGYRHAIADGASVIVKIDGDGQMDPALLQDFVAPILSGEADYTKGNRFWNLREIRRMPLVRRLGNLGLSFFAKASTGYWDLFDPTNGYTAIHASVASRLPMESISRRYFFETDVLFRLNAMRAVVVDIPMDARYGDEVSNLSVPKVLGEFLAKHLANAGKRIGYSYFLRDLSIGSLELVAAVGLLGFGAVFGGWHWWLAAGSGVSAPLGTVMIATVAVVSGLQFLLAFLNYDIASVPRRPLHRVLSRARPVWKGERP